MIIAFSLIAFFLLLSLFFKRASLALIGIVCSGYGAFVTTNSDPLPIGEPILTGIMVLTAVLFMILLIRAEQF